MSVPGAAVQVSSCYRRHVVEKNERNSKIKHETSIEYLTTNNNSKKCKAWEEQEERQREA